MDDSLTGSFDLSLASDLLDAAIDEERWPDLLERLARGVGAKSSVVISVNLAENSGFQGLWRSRGMPEELLRRYNEEFSAYEAHGIPVIRDSERFTILTERCLWPDEPDLYQRPDFVALREMAGINHRIAARINEDRSWFNTLSVQYAIGRPNASEAERKVFSAYLPFVAQTVNLSNVFQRLKARYKAVLGVLDRFLLPVVLVDESSRVSLANASADLLFQQDLGAGRDATGRLRLWDELAQARLAKAVRDAAATAKGDADEAVALFHAERRDGGDPFCIEVTPLRDTDREMPEYFRGAMVRIYDPEHHPVVQVGSMAKVHGLTDSEISIAHQLVSGFSTEEIAETRGTSPLTVRTQVKNLLVKTSCKNRTDLVRRALIAHLPIA